VADKLVPVVAVNRLGVAVSVADKAVGAVVWAIADEPTVNILKSQKNGVKAAFKRGKNVDLSIIGKLIMTAI